jgi:hypothetical protein
MDAAVSEQKWFYYFHEFSVEVKLKINDEDLEFEWTAFRDGTGTYRLTETVNKRKARTLITSSDRENFYDMLDKRRERYALEGLSVNFHDTTLQQTPSDETRSLTHHQ